MHFESFNENNNQTVNLKISLTNEGPADINMKIGQTTMTAGGSVKPKVKKQNKVVNTMRKINIKFPYNYLKHKNQHDQKSSSVKRVNRLKLG